MRFLPFYGVLTIIYNLIINYCLFIKKKNFPFIGKKKLFINYALSKHKKGFKTRGNDHNYSSCNCSSISDGYNENDAIIYGDKCSYNSYQDGFVSTLESPIIGLKIGQKLNKEKLTKNKKNTSLFLLNNSNNKLNFKLKKELFLCRNRSLLNNLLCLYYLPNVSKAYLKGMLESFSLNDLLIKENILYHLSFRYLLTGNQSRKKDCSKDQHEELLKELEKDNYKFILNHARILKKYVKKMRREQKEQEGEKNSKQFFKGKVEQMETQTDERSTPPYNKIIDIHLKMRKKMNIIFVSINKENNIYNMYKKVKRNITFYDFYDRLIILNYFYRNEEYRLLLLFFKNYVYKMLSINNIFIINFINKLNKKNILSDYLINPNFTYNNLLSGTSLLHTNNTDKYKIKLLPVNKFNFFNSYMKDQVYFKNKRCTYSDINFLTYVYMLKCFLKRRNYYFLELFMKQFCLYYSENINILYDHYWYYFFITLSFSMKIFYEKKKFHVINYEHTNLIEDQNNPFINHINIFNEDIFTNTNNYNTSHCKHLNSKIISYIEQNIAQLNSISGEGGIFKSFSLLLMLQYVFLLHLNIDTVDFVNKQSAYYFANNMANNTANNTANNMANNMANHVTSHIASHCSNDPLQNGIMNNSYENITKRKKKVNKIEELKNITAHENELLPKRKKNSSFTIEGNKNSGVLKYAAGSFDNTKNFLLRSLLRKKKEDKKEEETLHSFLLCTEKRKKIFSIIIKGYKEILRSSTYKTVNETILMYNNTFEELHMFMENYITDIVSKSLRQSNEMIIELMFNVKSILSMCKINICFFFMLLSTFDTYNFNTLALHLLYENNKFMKSVKRGIHKMIVDRFKKLKCPIEENNKFIFQFEKVLLEYNTIYSIYKSIIKCNNKEKIKILMKKLMNKDKTNTDIFQRIFKTPILALNLKQIFFIFYSLNNYNLHNEIIHLFWHIMKYAHFKKSFYNIMSKKKKKQKKNTWNKIIKEKYNLCKKILFIYFDSTLRMDNSYHFSEGANYMKSFKKFFFFYRNPLYIFNYFIKKYKSEKCKIEKLKTEKCKIYTKSIKEGGENEEMKEELQKIEEDNFFDRQNIKKLKDGKIFKCFFLEKIYTLVSEKEYTLLFNGLMNYLYKNNTTLNCEVTRTSKNEGVHLHVQYVYLYFYLTWKGYLKRHKISNINFLTFLKTCLLMDDMDKFQKTLLLNQNIACKNYLFINSFLNNHLVQCKTGIEILRNYLAAPVDIYIMHKGQLIIFNLNYYEIIKRIDEFVKYKTKTHLIFFIDYRKIFISLMNLEYFFSLAFLYKDKFLKFLGQEEIILNHDNFFNISEFVIFYGKCIKKKKKILHFFYTHYKSFYICANKNIKDAFIVTLK
ncbi:conserved Plasmodium protein, unknown function [Plasmodium malariae]|uniref:Uncharacterized protein n=1 Tax=Plasmodium malariae TaxID=5858 RepID=A0A1A8WKI2_PLAMA|nr:conserved Plasmodium protein, unknown function [Plasmodium malariae]SBS93469.1 conserved Plasmodium protein, unknown function [Plasmodium malariae]SCO93215.1 conserved Plasmodium protein, unknown function [Plasmodium malariae]